MYIYDTIKTGLGRAEWRGNMEKIRVEMKCVHKAVNYMAVFLSTAFAFWIAILIRNFSAVGLVLLLLSVGAATTFFILSEKLPTIAEADGNSVSFRYMLGWKSVRYDEIDKITCEPNVLRGRYSSTQCVKLTISTENDEYVLNQMIDTNKMLKSSLDGEQSDIEVMRLYDFIKEKSGK